MVRQLRKGDHLQVSITSSLWFSLLHVVSGRFPIWVACDQNLVPSPSWLAKDRQPFTAEISAPAILLTVRYPSSSTCAVGRCLLQVILALQSLSCSSIT